MKILLEKLGELRVLDSDLAFDPITRELTVTLTGVTNDDVPKQLIKRVTIPGSIPTSGDGFSIIYPEFGKPFDSLEHLMSFADTKNAGDIAFVADTTQPVLWSLYVWSGSAWIRLVYINQATNIHLGVVKGTGYADGTAVDAYTKSNICSIENDGRIKVPSPTVTGVTTNLITYAPPYGILLGETTKSLSGTLKFISPWKLYATRAEMTVTADNQLVGIRLWLQTIQDFASAIQTSSMSNILMSAVWENIPLNAALSEVGIIIPTSSTFSMKGSCALFREATGGYAHNRTLYADCKITNTEEGQDSFNIDLLLQGFRVYTSTGTEGGAYSEWEQAHNVPDVQVVLDSFSL